MLEHTVIRTDSHEPSCIVRVEECMKMATTSLVIRASDVKVVNIRLKCVLVLAMAV